MCEPIIKEFTKLPAINITANKYYLFDSKTTDKDDIECFVNQTISSCMHKTDPDEPFIGFVYNPSPSVLYDINKYKVIKTFITCFNIRNEVNLNNTIILTKINYNKYKYKQFDKEKNIYITHLYNNIQIQPGENFNVIPNERDHDILYIYITETKPFGEAYVRNLTDVVNKIYEAVNITSIVDVTTSEKLDYQFFNELLYMRNINNDTIKKITDNFIEKGHTINLSCDDIIDLNSSSLIRHIECVYSNNLSLDNRFINRRELKGILDKNFCACIVSNYTRIANNYQLYNIDRNYTFYEPISYLIHSKILPYFIKCYNIPENDYIINAKNIHICRNIDTNDANINKKTQNYTGVVAIDIMISSNDDCLGFSRKFVDDTAMSMSTGDAIIYNPRLLSNTNSANDKIYLLSFEIELISLLHINSIIY